MALEHACFISYKHPPPAADESKYKHEWLEFVEALENHLQRYLTKNRMIARDTELKEQGGIKYPGELSKKICKSACLVAILQPEYIESNWCRAEWEAMADLERARGAKADREGLIIPILYQGEDEDMHGFAKPYDVLDFRNVLLPKIQLRKIKYVKMLKGIAKRIDEFVSSLEPGKDCDEFLIQVGKEISDVRHHDPSAVSHE